MSKKKSTENNPEPELINYLNKKGLKLTNQRRLIVNEFFKEDKHLSAEELYHILRGIDSYLGQATVYRTLKLLCEAGLARQLQFGDDVTRFEPRLRDDHHDHLICDDCGKTVSVYDEEIEKRQAKVAEENGFTLTSHRMYLYGICAECRKKSS